MSRIYKAVTTGDMSGPPALGQICSVALVNTSGAAAGVVITDDGGLEIAIDLAANGSEQFTYNGVDYRGDLSIAGDAAADVIVYVEID